MRFKAIAVVAVLSAIIIGNSILLADENNPLSNIYDASGMFNERGIYKSNSFSLVGNEAVNDFNGNLIYNQRLKYLPISQNGLQYDLQITYNGSVGHMSWQGYQNFTIEKPALNLPEWIISLNGIAVQTFNFENDIITRRTLFDEKIAEDDDISTLVNGYHNCYTWRPPGEGYTYSRGIIQILMGDGSIKEFYSEDHEAGYLYHMIYGRYHSLSKEDKSTGYLYHINHQVAYFVLFQENGTKVTFKVYKPEFSTCIAVPYMEDDIFPDMFLPIKFEDNMGHSIDLTYTFAGDNDTIYGRPLIESIGELEFDWGDLDSTADFNSLQIKTNGNTNHTIYFENTPPDPANGITSEHASLWGDKNRAYVSHIEDAEGRYHRFTYRSYLRKLENLPFSMPWQTCDTPPYFVYRSEHFYLQPWRLYLIQYPDGGLSFNHYYNDQATNWALSDNDILDTLDVNYETFCSYYPWSELPCRKSTEFVSLGRDPFYINMVVSVRRTQEDTSLISFDSLDFSWIDEDDNDKISVEDSFYTDRWLSKDHNINDSNQQVKHKKNTYSYYPEPGPFSQYTRDRSWLVKLQSTLIAEKNHEDAYTVTTEYDWDDGACGGTCNGTFKLFGETTTYNDGATEESVSKNYNYFWHGDPSDQTVVHTDSVEEVDSWGFRSKNHYNTSYIDITDEDDYYNCRLSDSVKLYKVTVPWEADTLLRKQVTEYYDGLTGDGFKGQPYRQIEYCIDLTGTIIDSIEEKQYYYKDNTPLARDSGALRKRSRTVSYSPLEEDSIIYYYGNQTPETITYHKMAYDGTLYENQQTTFDDNGPFWFKKEAYYKRNQVDEKIVNYQLIDSEGKLTWVIDPNKYGSQLTYDLIDRVEKIILPFGHKLNSDPEDSAYSIRYLHFDQNSGLAGDTSMVTIRNRVGPDEFLTKNRTLFDGHGRAFRSDAENSSGDTTSVWTTHDFANRTTELKDQLLYTTYTEYDHLDRLIKNQYPDQSNFQTQVQYSTTNALSLGLDSLFSFPDNAGLIFVKEYIDENGHSVYEYTDVRGKLRLLRKNDGIYNLDTYFDYDNWGNLIRVIKPKGDEVTYTYNSLGQLTKENSPDFGVIDYGYDYSGNMKVRRDTKLWQLGTKFNELWQYYKYDALGRHLETGIFDSLFLDPDSIRLQQYFYDQQLSDLSIGRLSVTFSYDPNDLCDYAERYHYDARGRIKRQINYFSASLDSVWINNRFEKNPVGDSVVFEYEYNLTDQITAIKYPDCNLPNGLTVTYNYDDLGRLKEVGKSGDPDFFASLSHTTRNELERIVLAPEYQDSGFQTIDYLYNPRGWLTSINEGTSSLNTPDDLFGQRLYYYTSPHDLADSIPQFNGNVWGQDISINGSSQTYVYSYDAADRLILVQKENVDSLEYSEGFWYDKNGNMIHKYGDGFQPTSFTYWENSNRLIRTGITNINSFLYDANGNMIRDSVKQSQMKYDDMNRMQAVKFDQPVHGDTNRIYFGYNAGDERIYKLKIHTYETDCVSDSHPIGDIGILEKSTIKPPPDNSSGNTNSNADNVSPLDEESIFPALMGSGPSSICYAHDTVLTHYLRGSAVDGKVLAEKIDGSLSVHPQFRYIYAGDTRIAMYDKENNLYFYLNDHLGSTRAVVKYGGSGQVTDKYWYDVYGSSESQTSFSDQKHRYTGKPFDDDIGIDIYYYGARYYDPELGRFLSVDPLASKYPDLSPYAYCANNPLKFVDKDGNGFETGLDIVSTGLSTWDLIKNPSWENVKWLAVDVVGAVIPFLPAAGIVRHGAKAANKTVKAADKGSDAAKTLKKGSEANRGIGPKHGNKDHDDAINNYIDNLPEGATDVRKHQTQVDYDGNKRGNNLPDVQYNNKGKHHNVEYDRNARTSRRHGEVINRNDPESVTELILLEKIEQ
jgi:RHS repeat-associated protein